MIDKDNMKFAVQMLCLLFLTVGGVLFIFNDTGKWRADLHYSQPELMSYHLEFPEGTEEWRHIPDFHFKPFVCLIDGVWYGCEPAVIYEENE